MYIDLASNDSGKIGEQKCGGIANCFITRHIATPWQVVG
jgi:hypothetical protein